MPVKALVDLYETNAAESSSSAKSTSGAVKLRRTKNLNAPTQDTPLAPSPARFIRQQPRTSPLSQPHAFHSKYYPITPDYELTAFPESSRDRSPSVPSSLPSSPTHTKLGNGIYLRPTTQSHYTQSSQTSDAQNASMHLGNIMLPSTASSATLLNVTDDGRKGDLSSSAGLKRHMNVTHVPVPASTIFAADAHPLHLPTLDKHLASLPTPSFPPAWDLHNKQKTVLHMFPPMDRLAKTGKSIQDLETNSTIRPSWRNRNTIFGGLANLAVGATGSSVLASFYSLQGVIDTVQIFALVLSTVVPHAGKNIESKWKQLFLGTIPNVLALTFASTLVQSLIFLGILMAFTVLLLYCFYKSTNKCKVASSNEGFQRASEQHHTHSWGLIVVAFVLTVLYLPLSTIAVHALVWSEDFWVVPNPYINATSLPPEVSPLGPPDQFRDPLDFCYTTTMKRNQVNFAPVVVIASTVACLLVTIWFPLRLRKVIVEAVPHVDAFTELGERRSESDLDREYQRLLDRDRNPITFLYKDFRRGWGTYRSLYLLAKLSALVIIALIDPDNCLFRSLARTSVAIVRQVVLILAMICFFLAQCFLGPFLDPVDNASEWTSRLCYVLTALIGLAVALNIPGVMVWNTPILYIVYILTYGLNAYFALINLSWVHRLVKKITRRVDFSVDIFSPSLDVSPASRHIKRRIWQEAISCLLLTSPECKIPDNQPMRFADARDGEYPPYLLDFQKSPAERHVENLKILREVGTPAYAKAVNMISGGDKEFMSLLQTRILRRHIGPDCYWKPPKGISAHGRSSYFGNAWWIPFPPTLVLRYDEGPLVLLNELRDFQDYVTQNESEEVIMKRQIRLAFRALDGRVVSWPYEHQHTVGTRTSVFRRQYNALSVVRYRSCVLEIKRHGDLVWEGHQLGSGFSVELTYAKDLQVDGSITGLNDDYDLNPHLARFLAMNHPQISLNLPKIESTIQAYRDHLHSECGSKANVLSYEFLQYAYDQPQKPRQLMERVARVEHDLRVRQLIAESEIALDVSNTRVRVVTTSKVATWWYIFWDDVWRRNNDTITTLQTHVQDFNPHYQTSIAYSPLPRSALEAFLTQRGLLSRPPRTTDIFHTGFLNKLYVRVNDIIFQGTDQAIMFHVGDGNTEVDLEDIDLATQARPSTLGTGGGTDHDDVSIRARPNYKWEDILGSSPSSRKQHSAGWVAKLGVWFGVTNLWRTADRAESLSLDVALRNDHYVLLNAQL